MPYQLNTVKPKHTLLAPCPCEERCAHIRNETVDLISKNDVSGVAFRYLQSRAGQVKTRTEAICSILLAIAIGTAYGIPTYGLGAINSIVFFGNAVPNLGNTGRYRKTKRGCKEWLKNRLGEEHFKEIQKLQYTEEDIQELSRLLREYGETTDTLDHHRPRVKPGCWI